jgi:hypothetical protein
MKFATLALLGAAAAHEGFFQKWGKKFDHKMHHIKEKFHHGEEKFWAGVDGLVKAHTEKKTHELGLEEHMSAFGLEGINIAALLACIGEEDKAALVLDAAVQTLEDAYKTKNYEEAVGGAIAIYAAYQQAVQGIPACEAIPKSAFEKKLATPMTEDNKKQVAEIMQGFLKGSNVGTFNFTALLECIYSADQAAEVMYVATTQIIPEAYHDKQPVEALIGLFFMYSAVETFETQALPICEQVDAKSNWNNFADHPEASINHGRIMINEEDVTKTLLEAGDLLKDGKFYDFGEKVGTIAAAKKAAEVFLY